MLLDRENGGDWIDADTRWILVRLDPDGVPHGGLALESMSLVCNVFNAECKHGVFDIDWGYPI